MDGVFSAIFTYNQLKKQGIPERNITLNSVQYGWDADEENRVEHKVKTKKGQALVVVDFAALPKDLSTEEKTSEKKGHKPEVVSDHHANTKNDLVPGKKGKIGATEFASDSEHIAVSYARNIADWSTVEAVSRIDGAKYTNIIDTLTLPTNFKSKGRMERLAILVNTLLSKLIKKNKAALEHLIRTAQPSLVSVYTNLTHAFKLNDLQVEGLEEINKESPDWDKINEIRKRGENK
jgi:hypothetical protein